MTHLETIDPNFQRDIQVAPFFRDYDSFGDGKASKKFPFFEWISWKLTMITSFFVGSDSFMSPCLGCNY